MREIENPSRPPLTDEDLDILATPTKDLYARASVPSFDDDKYRDRLKSVSEWQQIVQGHLYIDHVLSRTLSEALPNPDKIDIDRMGFASKMQLVAAMGLITDDIVGCFRSLNKLRNRIAHRLEYEISPADRRNLISLLPTFLRQHIESEPDREPGPVNIFEFLFFIAVYSDILRQRLEGGRLVSRKMNLRLRTVVAKENVVFND